MMRRQTEAESETLPGEERSEGRSAGRTRSWAARESAQRLFFALLVRPFMTLFIGLRVRGREHLPASDPFLLIANHSSHLDTVSLLSLFPISRLRKIQPVAAADYFREDRLVGRIGRALFNILPISRRKITRETNPIPVMVGAVAAGQSLIIFPEGTRGSGEEMGPFLPGVAHLIEKLPEVPVVPAYLVNMGRSLPKGEVIPLPVFCEIRLGAPRLIRGSREEILQALTGAVEELKGME